MLPCSSHLPLLVQAQYSSSAKEAQSVWTGWTILLTVFLVLAGALWVLDMVAYMRRRGEEPIDIVVSVQLEELIVRHSCGGRGLLAVLCKQLAAAAAPGW